MFLKQFKPKSNVPLKGSDSKRLRLRIQQSFANINESDLQTLIPNKGNVTMLKLTTHGGYQTSVYCVDKRPMFFEIEGGQLAPTLYSMWQVPDLLPYFTTVPGVLPKLSNGADLMLPGVIPQGKGLGMYGHYKKGQLVAVNLTTNRSAVGVGQLSRSSDDLYMAGGHGSCVKLLNIFGDKLWGFEPTVALQIPNNSVSALSLTNDDDFPDLAGNVKKTSKVVVVENVVIPDNEIVEESTEDLPVIDNLQLQEVEDANSPNVDDVLRNAFLAALKHNHKTLTLPLLTSNFYRLYVVPEATTQIELKHTKYKKLSNFLSQMCDEGLIVVREESKGVDKIISIDYNHPDLLNFVADRKLPGEGSNNQQEKEQPLFHSAMTELYLVTDETIAFFTKLNYKLDDGINHTQVKKLLKEYVSKNQMSYADAGRKIIKLDDCLANICQRQAATLDDCYHIILGKMRHTYEMRSCHEVTGNKPTIQMSVATRSGNKKVTLVSNLESYGIILAEFIKICKQGAAASTTIVKLPSQKSEQLQIQGNQIRYVYDLLTEKYKIPPKQICGLNFAKPVKKSSKK